MSPIPSHPSLTVARNFRDGSVGSIPNFKSSVQRISSNSSSVLASASGYDHLTPSQFGLAISGKPAGNDSIISMGSVLSDSFGVTTKSPGLLLMLLGFLSVW